MAKYKLAPNQSFAILPGLGRLRPGRVVEGDLDAFVGHGVLVEVDEDTGPIDDSHGAETAEANSEGVEDEPPSEEGKEGEPPSEDNGSEGADDGSPDLTHDFLSSLGKEELLLLAEERGVEVPSKIKRGRVAGIRALLRKSLLGAGLVPAELEHLAEEDIGAVAEALGLDVSRAVDALAEAAGVAELDDS